MKTKQRLRVSQQRSVARLEFVMTHDASNDFFFDQFKMKKAYDRRTRTKQLEKVHNDITQDI